MRSSGDNVHEGNYINSENSEITSTCQRLGITLRMVGKLEKIPALESSKTQLSRKRSVISPGLALPGTGDTLQEVQVCL